MSVFIGRFIFQFCRNVELKQLRVDFHADVFVDMLTFNRFHSFNVIFNFTQCCTYERVYRVIISVPISERKQSAQLSLSV